MDVHGCRGAGGWFVVRLCLFLIVVGEFFFVPGVVAEGGVGDAARVDHYLLGAGLKGGAAEIGGGGLQA